MQTKVTEHNKMINLLDMRDADGQGEGLVSLN